MILIDTSALIDSVAGPRRSLPRLRQLIQEGEKIRLSTLVLFEWRRGPRVPVEIADQETLFPSEEAIPFGPAESLLAAEIYRTLKRSHGREIDIAIAACAIVHESRLWTLNTTDFNDVPNLRLI